MRKLIFILICLFPITTFAKISCNGDSCYNSTTGVHENRANAQISASEENQQITETTTDTSGLGGGTSGDQGGGNVSQGTNEGGVGVGGDGAGGGGSSGGAGTTGGAGGAGAASESSAITVKVTEKIPGAGCGNQDPTTKLYTCTIQPGFSTIQMMIGQIIKWFTAIAALAGVLFIVVNGILLSANGSDQKAKVKERIAKTITGLILLLLSGLILSIIAPWVYK